MFFLSTFFNCVDTLQVILYEDKSRAHLKLIKKRDIKIDRF